MAVDPIGGQPQLVDHASGKRIVAATKYVERFYRGSGGARGFDGPFANPLPGVYAFIAASAAVSGASGLSLGSGSATLCSRSPGSPTCVANGPVVTFYNAGGGFTAGVSGQLCKLGWVNGDWSLDVTPCV